MSCSGQAMGETRGSPLLSGFFFCLLLQKKAQNNTSSSKQQPPGSFSAQLGMPFLLKLHCKCLSDLKPQLIYKWSTQELLHGRNILTFCYNYLICPCPSLPGFLTPGCLCPAKVKNYTLNKGNNDVGKSSNFRLLILQWAQALLCRVSANTPGFDNSKTKKIQIPLSSALKQGISFFPSVFPALKGVNLLRRYRPCCVQWNRAAS